MIRARKAVPLCAAALLLAGCSFSTEALWPSLSGESPTAAAPQTQQIRPSAGEQSGQPLVSPAPPPQLGTTNFQVQAPRDGQPTGTFVGQKVAQLRDDLRRLQDTITAHNGSLQSVRNQTIVDSQIYHGTVAAINARLQVGTTPGNPVLVQQWNQAQQQLDQINNDIAQMNNVANQVAADSALATYLLEAVRAAFGLSGAIEEDHRQLAALEDDVNRTVVLIDRLLNELSDDIGRQTTYVSNERSNLNTLALAVKNGELYGQSLRNRAYASAGPMAAPRGGVSAGPASVAGARRPLMVIRFDRPNPEYKQALYTAVSRALERAPDAHFDVVAVSPQRAGAAVGAATTRRNAESVLRALNDMGLPAGRVSLSALSSPGVEGSEVQVFVR